MSEVELYLATALQKAGVLEDGLRRAQQFGLSLTDFIVKVCRNEAFGFEAKDSAVTSLPKSHKSDEELWAEMMALPTAELTRQLGQVYHECGIADMSGEELRGLCRD